MFKYKAIYINIMSLSHETVDKYGGKGLTGLANLGNTCYLNSCMQIISHTYMFNNFLDSDYKTKLNKKPEEIKEKYYDVILCMEIVEHVEDVSFFIESCVKLLKNNGIIFFATLNKTIKSFVFAIIGAEYVLRWLPIGTHDWKKFISPNEIINKVSKHYLTHVETRGVIFNPLKNKWSLSDDTDVNYMCYFNKN